MKWSGSKKDSKTGFWHQPKATNRIPKIAFLATIFCNDCHSIAHNSIHIRCHRYCYFLQAFYHLITYICLKRICLRNNYLFSQRALGESILQTNLVDIYQDLYLKLIIPKLFGLVLVAIDYFFPGKSVHGFLLPTTRWHDEVFFAYKWHEWISNTPWPSFQRL